MTRKTGKQRRAERKARGVCERCPNPVHQEGGTMCVDHLAALRGKYNERRENNLCIRCGKKPPAPNRVQCTACSYALYDALQERKNKKTTTPKDGTMKG